MPATEQDRSVWIMPALNRKIATIAAADRSSAQGSMLKIAGTSKDRPKLRKCRSDLVKPGVQGKPDSEIEDHTNDGSGDARERAVQGLVVPQPLDKGRAKADPQKAGYECAPGGEQPAEGACNRRWQRARMPERCEKADELHNHDQRSRRRLGHAEPIEHFARP